MKALIQTTSQFLKDLRYCVFEKFAIQTYGQHIFGVNFLNISKILFSASFFDLETSNFQKKFPWTI